MGGSATYGWAGEVDQTFVPPTSSVYFDLRGARGGYGYHFEGNSAGGSAGYGGRVWGTLSTSPGETLHMHVGQIGGNAGPGYGGGRGWPAAGYGGVTGEFCCGGGGGYSAIWRGGQGVTLVAMAGGGGGGGSQRYWYDGTNAYGGGGGFYAGGNSRQPNTTVSGTTYYGDGGVGGSLEFGGGQFSGAYRQGGQHPNGGGGGGGGEYGGGNGGWFPYAGADQGKDGGGGGCGWPGNTWNSTIGQHDGYGYIYYSWNRPPTNPGAPSVANPASGTHTVSWGASSDPDGDGITYHVDYESNVTGRKRIYDGGATSFSHNFGAEGATQSGRLYVLAEDNSAPGTYNGSGWIASGTFTVNRTPAAPGAITVPNPASGTHTISWGAGSDPDGQALTYQTYLGYANANWVLVHNAAATSVSVDFSARPARNDYVVHVYSTDSFGAQVGPTVSGLFTVNRVPGAPGAFTSPTSGQSVPSTVTVTWGAASDADSNINNYELEFWTGSAWVAISTANNTSRSVDLSGRAATASAKFRARALDSLGGVGAWTESATFTVNRTPSAPTLTAPADGALFPADRIFSWTFVDSDAGQAQTAYAFRRTNNGVDQWYDGAGGWSSTETFVTSATSSITFPSGTWPAGLYTWSVATRDTIGGTAGTGPYATARSVTVPGGLNMIV